MKNKYDFDKQVNHVPKVDNLQKSTLDKYPNYLEQKYFVMLQKAFFLVDNQKFNMYAEFQVKITITPKVIK